MITLKDKINYYKENYTIVDVLSLTGWDPGGWDIKWNEFTNKLKTVRKDQFENSERVLFIFDVNDYDSLTFEVFFKKFIRVLNKIDISNFFAVILTNGSQSDLISLFQDVSADTIIPTVDSYIADTIPKEKGKEKDTFCVAPWIHQMVTPYHWIKTCCIGEDTLEVLNNSSLGDAWNNKQTEEIRKVLLNNSYHTNCTKCYEQEKNNKQSLRMQLNSDFASKVIEIKEKKQVRSDDFKLLYLDIRFTNLCNIRCRTCNHHSSSKWYQDEVKLNPSYNKPVIMKAGKTDTDVWEQVKPHLAHVEKIYFAGGEPMIMEEHYKILEELERLNRFDVTLFYNTNFTQMKLKDRSVFDYWKKFKKVSVGASLDAMGTRAEYIRKDSIWSVIESNRRQMKELCPDTKFGISATASILNVWHLPDLHRHCIENKLIGPSDIMINWVQEPNYYRVDIGTTKYKNIVKEKITKHCDWLSQFPGTETIRSRYKSLVDFMFSNDQSYLLPTFWETTKKLDQIRGENVFEVLPELNFLNDD